MHVVHENDSTCRSINLKLKTVSLENTHTFSFTDDEWYGNCQRQPPLMNEMLKGDIFIYVIFCVQSRSFTLRLDRDPVMLELNSNSIWYNNFCFVIKTSR